MARERPRDRRRDGRSGRRSARAQVRHSHMFVLGEGAGGWGRPAWEPSDRPGAFRPLTRVLVMASMAARGCERADLQKLGAAEGTQEVPPGWAGRSPGAPPGSPGAPPGSAGGSGASPGGSAGEPGGSPGGSARLNRRPGTPREPRRLSGPNPTASRPAPGFGLTVRRGGLGVPTGALKVDTGGPRSRGRREEPSGQGPPQGRTLPQGP